MIVSDFINKWTRKVPTWVLYSGLAVPPIVYFYWAFTNQLGVDPLGRLEHQYGEWALQLLIAGLLVTPLRTYAKINLIKFRRAIGLMAFFYVTLHLSVWVVLDKQFFWGEIWADILKRPYITIGMSAFLVMVPLAITSNNWSLRKIGAATWRKLHKLTYYAALAGAVHYLLLVKSWPPEPIIYLSIVVGLLLLRTPIRKLLGAARKPRTTVSN
jgi:sulfoxide reductase heme-binding subunit YedZ